MDLSKTLDKVFLVLPNYCLGQCISDFYQNYEFIQFCTSSVEAIFICKAFSESMRWSSTAHPGQPHWGSLWGSCWSWAVLEASNPTWAIALGTILRQKLGSV